MTRVDKEAEVEKLINKLRRGERKEIEAGYGFVGFDEDKGKFYYRRPGKNPKYVRLSWAEKVIKVNCLD